MSFEEAIEVNGELLNPLEGLERKDIPSQLEITLEDLERTKEKTEDNIPNAYITLNRISHATNFFELATNNARTIYSGKRVYWEDRVDINEKTEAVKGSGHWLWFSDKEAPIFKNGKGVERKYPIHINESAEFESHKIWGGERKDSVKKQYVNALLIRILAERHGIESAVYVPKKIVKFKGLPLIQNGRLEVVSLEEYCSQFNIQNGERFLKLRVPTIKEVKEFAQFFYEGRQLRLRVPPRSFKREGGDRVYIEEIPNKLYSERELRTIISEFKNRILRTMEIVHRYGGTFTEIAGNRKVPLSSLAIGNVSLGGTICDFDTVSFSGVDLDEKQKFDRIFCEQTLENLEILLKNL